MITIRTVLALLLALHASLSGNVTTLQWQQPRPAQLCFYGRALLFCDSYPAGPHAIQLGTCAPCVEHIHSGDVITVREVGGAAQRVRVGREAVRLPLLRR